jgi:hypothetical protein
MVSLLATALIGGLLYYTLKRSDVVYAQQRESQISQAAQQEAAAVSRAFASMSAVALVVDVAKVQESLVGAWRTNGLADTMVIDHGNRVFAASNAGYVGQQIQDPNWAAIRAQNREVLIRDEPTPGQERITVIEPICRLTFAVIRLRHDPGLPLSGHSSPVRDRQVPAIRRNPDGGDPDAGPAGSSTAPGS